MSDARCARCGLPFGEEPNQCGDYTGPPEKSLELRFETRVECRNREIANLHAFRRGAIRRLGRIDEMLRNLMEDME